jgi:hypothetical protein
MRINAKWCSKSGTAPITHSKKFSGGIFISTVILSLVLSGIHFGYAASGTMRARAFQVPAGASTHSQDLGNPAADRAEAAALLRETASIELNAQPPKKAKARKSRLAPRALATIIVTNTNNAGAGSLRQAIIDANTNGMPDQIIFNIPAADPGFDAGTGTFVIKPLTLLPPLTEGGTLIDGTTQAAFGGNTNPAGPEIVINGGGPPVLGIGLQVSSPNNAIVGLVIDGFGAGGGIRIVGQLATGNAVKGCYIGTDATGSAIVANVGTGVTILGGANANQIGGTGVSDRNVISGNRVGINIVGTETSTVGNNVVQGNYIGVNAAGTAALANVLNGVGISGSDDNLIGGTDPGAGNVCSGNGQNGVRVTGLLITDPDGLVILSINPAQRNTIQGNKLGTDVTGLAAIPNGIDGARLNLGATNNTVGGSTAAARNICSGNVAHGVHMDSVRGNGDAFVAVENNTVQGNFIGADATGTGAIPNQLPGVVIFFGARNNLIGGAGPGQGNLIAFNQGSTVDDGAGGFTVIPGAGVCVGFNPALSDPDFANDPVFGNRISGNSIHSNVGLGIDLNLTAEDTDAQDGPTPNDAGDADAGPNNFQNSPVLTSVATVSGNTVVTGTLNSTATTAFTIEFFANDACDPSGFGEGQIFLGSTSVTTNNAGNASFSATLPGSIGCRVVTATATDPGGNTSEFSNCKDQAPTVSCSVGTAQLWPPNHDLINVGLTVTASDNCPNPVVSVQVFSDEDDEAPTGDGNFSPDAKNIAAGTLRLRSERDGGSDGRVYLIIVTATDSSGNVSHCCSTVTVPKSQSAAAKNSVAAQAAAAKAFCDANGTAPPGYFIVGDGPIVGPKQ